MAVVVASKTRSISVRAGAAIGTIERHHGRSPAPRFEAGRPRLTCLECFATPRRRLDLSAERGARTHGVKVSRKAHRISSFLMRALHCSIWSVHRGTLASLFTFVVQATKS